jgi:pyruvate,water dikinase
MEVVGSRLGEQTVTVATRQRHARALRSVEASRVARVLLEAEAQLGQAQQIEWAIDEEGILRLLQSGPLVVGRRASPPGAVLGSVLATGCGAAPGQAIGPARPLETPEEGGLLRDGDVLVVTTPSPDWIPCLERVGAVVADRGGVTAHLAAVCRELDKPCVVGTGSGTVSIRRGDTVVVDGSCATVRSAPQTGAPRGAPSAVQPGHQPPGAAPSGGEDLRPADGRTFTGAPAAAERSR